MRIDVFCESGKEYGLGHLRRCENLVLHLQKVYASIDFQITFHSIFALPDYKLEIVIIDSYITPLSFYQSIECSLLICLDDFHRLPYPSNALILRPTLGAKTFKKSYGGEEYVILNPAFMLPKKQEEKKGRVLIHLGGSKQNKLLNTLTSVLQGDIHIINPYFTHPNFTTHSSLLPQEICDLIDSSEIVICAGGGGLNEVLSRGKKSIALCIANNQRTQITNAHFLPSVFTIFSTNNLQSKLSYALKALFALPSPPPKPLGKFLQKWLYQSVLPLISAKNALHFCMLTHNQKLEVLALRNQLEVRENSLNQKVIGRKEHFDFISSLNFSQFFWAFFEDESKRGEIIAVGSLSLQHNHKATLGIYKNLRYKNIGTKILHSLFLSAKKLNVNTIELDVYKHNQKAIHLYNKNGFKIKEEKNETLIMEKNL